jgi:hypothetical protein
MVTGLYYHHGIVNNSFYDPVSKKFSLGNSAKRMQVFGGNQFGMLQKSKGIASFIGQVQIQGENSPSIYKTYDGSRTYTTRIETVWSGSVPEQERPHLITCILMRRITRGTPSDLYLMRIELWCKMDSIVGVLSKTRCISNWKTNQFRLW